MTPLSHWANLDGSGTLVGPAVVAVVMSVGVESLRSITRQYLFVVGAVTLLVVVPGGLGGVLGRLGGRGPTEAPS
ncbi:MAG: hypothetical protein DMD96_29260 [Candidatus Rokuibacteriota bacterium]|nr:MAG: hypothetical protein DMD96_29260 [Candidatus Rokubacteria bacterium]